MKALCKQGWTVLTDEDDEPAHRGPPACGRCVVGPCRLDPVIGQPSLEETAQALLALRAVAKVTTTN